jgi:Lrp/AsnC family transcriptional regulator, leucine-responsive regulatory protein
MLLFFGTVYGAEGAGALRQAMTGSGRRHGVGYHAASRGEGGAVDDLDRRILVKLQEDGSLTNARLAETLGLSQSAMSERERRLQQDGHIQGYRAIVAPASLGIGLQAFVAAELVRHGTDCIEEFERGVRALPEVRACYHVAGRFDYLLHVAVHDLEHLGQVVKTDIAAIPGVDRVETMLVYSEVKPDAGWPAPDEELPGEAV